MISVCSRCGRAREHKARRLCKSCYVVVSRQPDYQKEWRRRGRSHLRKGRKRKRRSDAKLTRSQVHAAHELYRAGWSVPELAKAGWKKWGYTNETQAKTGLLRAFALDQLPRRSISEARYAFERRREACSCGVKLAERNFKCSSCRHRHRRYEKAGLPHVPSHRQRFCLGCNVPVDEFTVGCRRCQSRHLNRRKKAALSVERAA